jgi:predicted small metal-binding protein
MKLGGSEMAKEVTCPPCGQTIRGESDDELVSNVISHAKSHGHEVGDADRDHILSEAREI